MSGINLGDWLAEAKKKLSLFSETPGLDMQVLSAHILGKTRAQILAFPESVLSEEQLNELEKNLSRIMAGEALPHILGTWEFFGRRFKLSKDVLIPRPETELLVENAVTWLNKRKGPQVIAEAGIGSGCISITLACETPSLIFASDISISALRVAKENIIEYSLQDRVFLVNGDLLTSFLPPFDLIVANLPYIPTSELDYLAVSHSEPVVALNGGFDGLQIIDRMLADSPRLLKKDGLLLLEIEEKQSEDVLLRARHFFPSEKIEVLLDLSKKPRLLRVERGST